jgi:predicted ABC-type ATPase
VKRPKPRCIIIAGPNGAGKTTFAREYLPNEAGVINFLNVDLLAAGIAPLKPELAARTAARMVLALQGNMVHARQDFSFETTMSGLTYVEIIKEWKWAGYHVTIVFLKLGSAALSLKRIASRVAQGGHHVPKADAIRRLQRGWSNFEKHYRDLADETVVFDLSGSVPSAVQQVVRTKGKAAKTSQGVEQALKRAAKEARRVAKMHGTKVWVIQDGKLVGMKP